MNESELLASFLPRLAREHLTNEGPPDGAIEARGAVLYSDIRGYTQMLVSATRLGHQGAETVSHILNTYFVHAINTVEAFGGDVLAFSGDSVLCFWPSPDDDPACDTALIRAVRCAVILHESMNKNYGQNDFQLRAKTSVGCGPVAFHHLKSVRKRAHFLATGPTIARVCAACSEAKENEVLLTNSAPPSQDTTHYYRKIRENRYSVEASPSKPSPPARPWVSTGLPDLNSLRTYAPEPVLSLIRSVGTETGYHWSSELRDLSILFIRLRHGEALSPAQLREVTIKTDVVLGRLDGMLHKIVQDDKGLILLAAFGLLPYKQADAALRAVHAATSCQKAIDGLGLPVSIGVSSGRVFCGTFGNTGRRHFTLTGLAVNWAARLSQSAERIVLIDEGTATQCQDRIPLEPLPPVWLKGRKEPMPVLRPIVTDPQHPRRPASDTPAIHTFVDREAEREMIITLFRSARDLGNGGLILIEGEPGIGKSMLVVEARTEACRLGMVPLFGAGNIIEATTPFSPWKTIFEQLFSISKTMDPGKVQAMLEDAVEEVSGSKEQLPLLNSLLSQQIPENDMTTRMSRVVRGEATSNLVTGLFKLRLDPRVHVIVIDDAQWMDSASWGLLLAIHRTLPQLAIIVSTRTRGKDAPEEYWKVHDDPGNVLVTLGPFQPNDSYELIARVLGAQSIEPAVVRIIQHAALGHPLFVEEMAHAMLDAGTISVVGGRCVLDDEETHVSVRALSDRANALVTSRLEALDPSHLVLVKVASVLGKTFTRSMLRAIDPLQLDDAHLDEALKSLETARLIVREGKGPDATLSFRHSLVQEAIYEMNPLEQRRVLHRKAAMELETRGKNSTTEPSAFLAYHWLRAGEEVKAAGYLIRASDQAVRRGANREAIAFCRQVVTMADREESRMALEYSPVERATIEYRIGEIYLAMGKPADAEKALRRASERLGIGFPRSSSGWIGRWIVQSALQVTHLCCPQFLIRSLSRSRRSRDALLARIIALLGRVEYHLGVQLAFFTASLQAVNLAERSGRFEAASIAYGALGFVAGMLRARPLVRRYFRRARATEDPHALCDIDLAEGVYLIGSGDLVAASSRLQGALDQARRYGDRLSEGTARVLLVTALAHRGELHAAYEAARELRDMGHADDNKLEVAWTSSCICNLSVYHPELDVLDKHVREASDLVDNEAQRHRMDVLFGVLAAKSFLAFRQGRLEEAQKTAQEAFGFLDRTSLQFSYLQPLETLHMLFYLLVLRRGGADTQTRRDIKEALRWLKAFSLRFPVGKPSFLHAKARNLRLQGRFAKAHAVLHHAKGVANGMGRQLIHGLIEREIGILNHLRGRDNEIQVQAAAECFADLGLEMEYRVIDSLEPRPNRDFVPL